MRRQIALVAIAAAFLALLPGAASAEQPVIVSISPSAGSTAGGTQVTISGSGFSAGAQVVFGGTYSTSVVVANVNTLVATTPPGSAGLASVFVIASDGAVASSPTQFQYQGSPVTITGRNFVATTDGGTTAYVYGSGFISGAVVSLGAVSVSANVVNSTVIVAIFPAGANSANALTVTNPDGSAATYGSTVTSSGTQPALASVQPSSGSPLGGTAVTITGTGFVTGATVSFGGVQATSVTVVSSTVITAVTPASTAGAVTVLVSNPAGAVGGLNSAFTYAVTPPVLTNVFPSSGSAAGGTAVTLTGTGFVTGATVSFGGLAASSVSVVSTTQIFATTPPGAVGAAVVLVTNPGGLISGLATGFTYLAVGSTPPPSSGEIAVTSVSPASGPIGAATIVTITGQGFLAGAIVTIGGVPATNVTVISSTQILASAPTTPAAGPALVVVSNAGGAGAALPGGYTYTSGTSTPPPTSTFPPGSSGLFVFAGGSNQALVTATGCPSGRLVLWATNPLGQWVGYIPGAPAVINVTWEALFPSGIPAGTAVYVKCSP